MVMVTKIVSMIKMRILTLINITVRGCELRFKKTTANYGYAFVENPQMLRWISSTHYELFRKDTTQFSPLFDSPPLCHIYQSAV